jgi:hypothetical protein
VKRGRDLGGRAATLEIVLHASHEAGSVAERPRVGIGFDFPRELLELDRGLPS